MPAGPAPGTSQAAAPQPAVLPDPLGGPHGESEHGFKQRNCVSVSDASIALRSAHTGCWCTRSVPDRLGYKDPREFSEQQAGLSRGDFGSFLSILF